mgnify:CR=1 FL=1
MDGFRVLEIKKSVFESNDREADLVREQLKRDRTFLLNLMSSPGSGKTTTLKATIAALKDEGNVDQAVFDEYKAKFMKAMDNDLNTSMAVTVLYDVLKAKTTDATKLAALDSFDQVLGLKLTEKAAALRKAQEAAPAAGGFTVVSENGREDPQVEALIRARADAKKAKNFAEADRIRDELKAQGVEITDVPGGVKWKRA